MIRCRGDTCVARAADFVEEMPSMENGQPLPQRRSIRLAGFDYTRNGAHFVTIATDARRCLFGEIRDERLFKSRLGEIAVEEWLAVPRHRPTVELGPHCPMPNHLHAIVSIVGPPSKSLGDTSVAPTQQPI